MKTKLRDQPTQRKKKREMCDVQGIKIPKLTVVGFVRARRDPDVQKSESR